MFGNCKRLERQFASFQAIRLPLLELGVAPQRKNQVLLPQRIRWVQRRQLSRSRETFAIESRRAIWVACIPKMYIAQIELGRNESSMPKSISRALIFERSSYIGLFLISCARTFRVSVGSLEIS